MASVATLKTFIHVSASSINGKHILEGWWGLAVRGGDIFLTAHQERGCPKKGNAVDGGVGGEIKGSLTGVASSTLGLVIHGKCFGRWEEDGRSGG